MALVSLGTSRVSLDSWNDLVSAASEGLLDETTFCELKKNLPPRALNTETARDVASLSVYGGVMVVGIADAGGGKAGDIVGVPDAEACKSRLVALAQGVVAPSLVCDVWIVPESEAVDSRRCVVCAVPSSATAPHFVDGNYWGRTAEGKRVLSDPEVADLFEKRRHRHDDFRAHLIELAGDFDPVEESARRQGHLYFAAKPLQPRPEAPAPWTHNEHVVQLLNRAGLHLRRGGGFGLDAIVYRIDHPFGISAQSFDPDERANEQYAAKLLVRDDGGVDFAAGQGTLNHEMQPLPGQQTFVPFGAIGSYVDECVRLTSLVSQEFALGGTWRLGVRVTELLGAVSLPAGRDMRRVRQARYQEREYLRVVDVSGAELAAAPVVVERLMKPLARGLGEARLFPYENPNQLFR